VFEDVTIESIKNDMLAEIDTDKLSTNEGSFANTVISGAAASVWNTMQEMLGCLDIIFVNKSSGEYVDKTANQYGITLKSGTYAEAGMTFAGVSGTVINAGKIFTTADGYRYILNSAVKIGTAGTGTGNATAESTGTAYNTPEGTIIYQQTAQSGITSVTNSSAATGGTDDENYSEEFERLDEYRKAPAASGNIENYKQWATSVDGVGYAKVIPQGYGAGTVQVILSSSDGGTVNDTIVSNCKAYIEEERPIGATVHVESATELSITVAASIETDGTMTADEIQEEFSESLESYLKENAFTLGTLLYNRVAYLLMDCKGVKNYSALTVNGGTADIDIGTAYIAVLGGVTISA
jgi:uncharacterized phage protein gp47/JayE